MNNSKIALDYNTLGEDTELDRSPYLRQREVELTEIIDAIQHIAGSAYWKVLQQKVFDGVLDSLKRRISNEKDTTEMFRLQGQIVWAEKYFDFDKMADAFRNELKNVRQQLTNDGASNGSKTL